jgi:hypothetical protein
MKMPEGGPVSDHLNDFNMLTNQLSSVGVKFDVEVSDILILCSFIESWNILVIVVSNFVSSSNTLKFDDVVGVILSKEMRWKTIGETSGNALTTKNRGRQRERGKSLGNHGKYRKGISKSKLENIMLELWEEMTSKERLQISKETRRWATRKISRSKCIK